MKPCLPHYLRSQPLACLWGYSLASIAGDALSLRYQGVRGRTMDQVPLLPHISCVSSAISLFVCADAECTVHRGARP
eukprot:6040585-Prymnesium_polylepis.1